MEVWGRSLGCGLSGRWRRLGGFLGRRGMGWRWEGKVMNEAVGERDKCYSF
jgi:hypothetical protein